MKYNKLLLRQIGKYFKGELIPPEFYPLLKVISESYDHYEKDRKMLERSIELTSAEMIELNNQLRQETEETRKAAYEAIRDSLNILHDEDNIEHTLPTQETTLQHFVGLLKEETHKRKQAELSRAQHQAHLQASQRIAHIGSWEMELTDANITANKVHWSEEAFEILGYKQGSVEMSAKAFFDRVDPNDQPLLMATLARAIETKTVYQLEHNLVLPGKKIKPVYSRAEIIYDEHTGRPLRVVGTLQDISERKKARQKLEKAHNELKTLFDNIQEVFYSVNMETNQLMQISQSCERVYGYSVKDFIKNPNLWLEVVLEEDKPIIFANSEAMYAGQPFSQEYRIYHKNGSIRWLESRLTPTLDKRGKLIRLDGTTVDITKRKEAELALKDSEVKFRYLIGNCADAIMIRNEDNTIVYCSDSVYNVIGYRPVEVIGKKTLDDIHPEDMGIVLAHRQKVLSNPGKPVKLVYRRIRKDGRYIWCEGTSTNMLHQPEVQGIVVNFRDITEMKEAELALKVSEKKFRYMISYSADAIMIMDKDRKVTYASDSIKHVTGFDPEELIGHSTMGAVHPEDVPLMLKHWESIETNPAKPIRITYRRLKKDGSYIWCDGTAINMLHKPELNGILINFRDVTERKEAELALKNSENKFRYLISNSADAIVIVNKHNETVYASDSIYRVTGYKPEEVIGTKTIDTVHPDDAPVILEHRETLLRHPDQPVHMTYRRLRKDGKYIWCDATAINLLDQPEVNGILINFRDVTERKEAELALRDSEYKFRSLIEYSADALMVLNAEGETVYASDSLYRIMGYEPEEILGVKAINFIYPEDIHLIQINNERVWEHPGKPFTITYRRIKKDGTVIWCEGTATNLLNEPAVNGVVINFRDITDRKNYEDALKASNEELRKSNSELDRFVYSVSHDLRAPLTSVMGLILLAEEETTDKNMLDYLKMIQSSVKKLDSFIYDILNYSRNSRLEIKNEPINFNELIHEVYDHLKFIYPDAPVAIETEIDDSTSYYTDKGRLSVVLNNLIANAIRYHNPEVPDPRVVVKVKTNESAIDITIADNGIGINKNYHNKVFEMFYRVAKKSEGSGLGLYIVKETIEKLNGNIQLSSEPGKGTTIQLTIPNLNAI